MIELTEDISYKGVTLKVTYLWEPGDVKKYRTPRPYDTTPHVADVKAIEVVEGDLVDLLNTAWPLDDIIDIIEEKEANNPYWVYLAR